MTEYKNLRIVASCLSSPKAHYLSLSTMEVGSERACDTYGGKRSSSHIDAINTGSGVGALLAIRVMKREEDTRG